MKFGIFVCMFVVLAYHEALGFSGPALLEGNCELEDFSPNDLAGCWGIKCTKNADGEISFSLKDCPLSRCSNGREVGKGKPDLTKTYPDCCPPHNCN